MLISGTADCGEGTERETGDGGRRFVASEPVEKGGEDSQRGRGSSVVLPAVVEVADRQSEVIERGQRVAVFGLKSGQKRRQVVTRWCGCRCLERSPGPGAGRYSARTGSASRKA